MGDPNLAFVRHKSRHAVSWALAAFQRLANTPCAMVSSRPLEGRTAFVVGAGPSLARNGELLREANALGAAVIAVNASDPVLRTMGVVPDAVVARESIDFSADIAESQSPLIVLDVCAHPAAWTAAGDRLAWFIPGYPRHFTVCQRIGVRPLFGGSSALCSAVALATEWGAAQIVLVGTDLALGPDGSAYHSAAPRGDCVGRVEGDRIHFAGNVRNDEITRASGQVTQPKELLLERVPSHDFGELLPTIDTWTDQRQWLEQHAQRYRSRVQFANATEGGAGVIGWRSTTLESVLVGIPQRDPVQVERWCPVDDHMQAQITEGLLAECDVLEQVSREVIAERGPDLRMLRGVEGIAYGAPMVETLAAWRTIDAPKGSGEERCRHVHGAFVDAAQEARGLLGRAGA